jgi:hypothetical protein
VKVNSNKTDEENDSMVHNIVQMAFSKYDVNKDNKFSFEEFQQVANSSPELQKLLTLGSHTFLSAY